MSLFPPKQHLFLPFFCLGNARWRSMNQFVIRLERAIVHHVLNQWFATKQPEESVRRQLQYKGAMSAVKSDIRLGCNRRPHRPTNYF